MASLSFSTGEHAGPWSELAGKALEALPALMLATLAWIVVVRLLPALPGLLRRLSNVEALGVKLALSGLEAQAMLAAVEMARKHARWASDSTKAQQDRALARANRERGVLAKAEILWVDDCPSNNRNEARMLQAFGVQLTFACSTREALEALSYGRDEKQPYHMIISDIARGEGEALKRAGLDMIPTLRAEGFDQPVVFYVGSVNADLGTPRGAFGVTHRPDELLNLTIDVLSRLRGEAA
jgi:CheY-like chemotaxis protein